MTSLCQVEGVRRSFGQKEEVHALRDVDLRIDVGDFVAIEGPSGSGKSTLMNVLGLLDRPSSGSYALDGKDTSELRRSERARMRAELIGFVFQEFHLLPPMNVVDNVALGASFQRVGRKERYVQAYAALTELGIEQRSTAYPPTLSGGERQRVAIARAIVGQKRLLLCDEPSGNLDAENTRSLVDMLIERNRRGMTIVVVTHDAQVAAAAHRRLTIVDGRIEQR